MTLKNWLLIFFIFLNIACFEQVISFNSDNKSGFITYKILLKEDFYKIVNFSSDRTEIFKFIKLLQDEVKIKELIEKDYYLKLVEYKKREINNNTEIYLSLYFSDKEKLSFQFKSFIFPIYVVEENKVIKCRVNLVPNISTSFDKIKKEYKYFIPSIIDAETFEKSLLTSIKSNIDKENILKVYKKSMSNNYIFESKYPNLEKFSDEQINELIAISNIFKNIKFEIKEKEIFNSYASIVKFKFIYKFPKPATSSSPISSEMIFSSDKKEIKIEYSLIDILSSDKVIENEFFYKRD